MNQHAFYLKPQWREHVNLMQHLTRYANVVVVITAEPQLGKTTLAHHLMEMLRLNQSVHYWTASPHLTTVQFCQHIIEAFNLTPSYKETNVTSEICRQILKDLHASEQQAVIVIDNAMHLTETHFDVIFDLVNLQSERNGRLHFILLGDPILMSELERVAERRDVKQQIYHAKLEPMDCQETGRYIKHYFENAAQEKNIIFTPDFVKQVHHISGGNPGKINELMQNELSHEGTSLLKRTKTSSRVWRKEFQFVGSMVLAAVVLSVAFVLHQHLGAREKSIVASATHPVALTLKTETVAESPKNKLSPATEMAQPAEGATLVVLQQKPLHFSEAVNTAAPVNTTSGAVTAAPSVTVTMASAPEQALSISVFKHIMSIPTALFYSASVPMIYPTALMTLFPAQNATQATTESLSFSNNSEPRIPFRRDIPS